MSLEGNYPSQNRSADECYVVMTNALGQHSPMQRISPAWWTGTGAAFLASDPQHICGALAARAMLNHRTSEAAQLRAWLWQINILREAVAALPAGWRVVLEYPLVRLGRRLDCVIVGGNAIFVVEFKHSDFGFTESAREQVADYAHDLRDFHAGCRHALLFPILVAASGRPARVQWSLQQRGVTSVFDCLPAGLGGLLSSLAPAGPATIDMAAWEHAPYRPVPTIIEAAQAIYARHGVEDIRTARADTTNLSRTTAAILQAVADARAQSQHIAVFVTGIPGAGKTLCGLNAVFGADVNAVFLTGTLPMVYVLKAAIAQDAKTHGGETARATKSGIQSITGFLRYYLANGEAPAEHLIVFDEAQRAWDHDYGARKFGLAQSEAALVLDIMRRHADYAVMVGLIGQGQEINTGEAGLAEWGRALAARPDWRSRAAPDAVAPTRTGRQQLYAAAPAGLQTCAALHLDVAIRNIRSEAAARWVEAVLRGDAQQAAAIADADLPFFLTRSQAALRAGLRARTRGRRRMGLVCSSGAKRLVADGLWPKFDHMNESVVANWFLKPRGDVRGADALEIPATEFAVQGLELDYVGLCWDGDLIWQGGWVARRFRGTGWQVARAADARDYRLNAYRVLLTRARADTIIYVPAGDAADRTRLPGHFDNIAAFLQQSGIQPLDETDLRTAQAADLFS
jgi:hypothetical protein